jgi:hypothetical protein
VTTKTSKTTDPPVEAPAVEAPAVEVTPGPPPRDAAAWRKLLEKAQAHGLHLEPGRRERLERLRIAENVAWGQAETRRDRADYPEYQARWKSLLDRANELERGTTTKPLLEAALGRRLYEPYGELANRVAYLADLEDYPEGP